MTAPISDELKPCPFCGEKPILADGFVECPKCFASNPTTENCLQSEAIASWNKRAPVASSISDEELEKLATSYGLDNAKQECPACSENFAYHHLGESFKAGYRAAEQATWPSDEEIASAAFLSEQGNHIAYRAFLSGANWLKSRMATSNGDA